MLLLFSLLSILLLSSSILISDAFSINGGIKARTFVFTPPKKGRHRPKLVLIGGAPGTGKSTFGMRIALDLGILKCISTDTVRAVMRSFIPREISPALHRSSYAPAHEHGTDDPVESWRETCTVLEASVEVVVEDAIERGVGLVLEGVSLFPSDKLIKKWEAGGGVAIGCLLHVSDADMHKKLLDRRGFSSGSGQKEKDLAKLSRFDRLRAVQDEMVRLAQQSNWLLIEQKVEPDPLEIVATKLMEEESLIFGEVSSEAANGEDSFDEILSERHSLG